MPIIIVDLSLSAQEYQHYYRGAATSVQAIARDGRTVNFPANILQQFVTHGGIHGSFAIHFNDDNKFMRVEELLRED